MFVWLKAYFNLKKNNRKSSSIIEEEKRQTVMKEEKKIVENVFNFWLLLKLKKKKISWNIYHCKVTKQKSYQVFQFVFAKNKN